MTAHHLTFLGFCAAGIAWAAYLVVSLLRDIKRRRPWWRETKRGDYVDMTRKWH